MDSLYEIGKDVGEVRARLQKLEQQAGGCGCKLRGSTGSLGLSIAEMSSAQRKTVAFLQSNHARVVAALNAALESLELDKEAGERIVVSGFQLAPASIVNQRPRDNICCLCQRDGVYCCDDQGCGTCS